MLPPSLHCRTIDESDWPSILRIQAQVYYAIVPESESVMRSKATYSPETCFVAADGAHSVLGYCLAYPYPANQVPALGQQLTLTSHQRDLEPQPEIAPQSLRQRQDYRQPQPINGHLPLGLATPLPPVPTTNLFLHDMAVDKSAVGRGIARDLFEHVLASARTRGYHTMSLVAIQQAASFWSKLGFSPSHHAPMDSSYASDAQFMTRQLSPAKNRLEQKLHP